MRLLLLSSTVVYCRWSVASVGGEAVRTADQVVTSDVRDTCASNRHFLLAPKSTKITEYRDTAPFTLLDAIVRNRMIVTWSSLPASFEVKFCPIFKTNTPLQRYCNTLNEDGLFVKIQQEMTP